MGPQHLKSLSWTQPSLDGAAQNISKSHCKHKGNDICSLSLLHLLSVLHPKAALKVTLHRWSKAGIIRQSFFLQQPKDTIWKGLLLLWTALSQGQGKYWINAYLLDAWAMMTINIGWWNTVRVLGSCVGEHWHNTIKRDQSGFMEEKSTWPEDNWQTVITQMAFTDQRSGSKISDCPDMALIFLVTIGRHE